MNLLAIFQFDFERSARSLAAEREALMDCRRRAVRNHEAVAHIDAELRHVTHLLLQKRRRRLGRAWA